MVIDKYLVEDSSINSEHATEMRDGIHSVVTVIAIPLV